MNEAVTRLARTGVGLKVFGGDFGFCRFALMARVAGIGFTVFFQTRGLPAAILVTHAREAPETACLAACGEGLCPEARAVIQATAPVIDHWLAMGYDLDTDILPVLKARTLRKRDDPIRTWAYFTPAISKRHAQRVALAARPKGAGEAGTVPTLTAYDILLRTAEWINSGRFVPPSAVNNTTRDALLRAASAANAWRSTSPNWYAPE